MRRRGRGHCTLASPAVRSARAGSSCADGHSHRATNRSQKRAQNRPQESVHPQPGVGRRSNDSPVTRRAAGVARWCQPAWSCSLYCSTNCSSAAGSLRSTPALCAATAYVFAGPRRLGRRSASARKRAKAIVRGSTNRARPVPALALPRIRAQAPRPADARFAREASARARPQHTCSDHRAARDDGVVNHRPNEDVMESAPLVDCAGRPGRRRPYPRTTEATASQQRAPISTGPADGRGDHRHHARCRG